MFDNGKVFWGKESNVSAFGDALSCAGELVNEEFWGGWSDVGVFREDSCQGAWARLFVPASGGVVGEVCARVRQRAPSDCVDLLQGRVDDGRTGSEVGEEISAVADFVAALCLVMKWRSRPNSECTDFRKETMNSAVAWGSCDKGGEMGRARWGKGHEGC